MKAKNDMATKVLGTCPEWLIMFFGWDATVEVVEDWMYEKLAEKYVLDKKMQEWFKEVNPYALQNMVERFLEAIERGLWNAADDMKNQLQRIYLDIEGLIEKAEESK